MVFHLLLYKKFSVEIHIRRLIKIVFLEHDPKRKRQKSRDEATLNVFQKSPAHDGRKFLEICCYFAISQSSYW